MSLETGKAGDGPALQLHQMNWCWATISAQMQHSTVALQDRFPIFLGYKLDFHGVEPGGSIGFCWWLLGFNWGFYGIFLGTMKFPNESHSIVKKTHMIPTQT